MTPPMRTGGRWTAAEVDFVHEFIVCYAAGIVGIPGASLRECLARALRCSSRRIIQYLAKHQLGSLSRLRQLPKAPHEFTAMDHARRAALYRAEHRFHARLHPTIVPTADSFDALESLFLK
ncbi:hypothetical protein ACHHYP_16335 [Achlya hypogyna]|uniref:Uncharacterized protein n=1 Tax=Achlya hypogyna TaxID=1202772 RepID=A0A1V9Y958_ACHHY|nr:hypothetical protein ACHHYP_16335 [Achlya hypogyna]